jgi:hypothetical protein
MLVVVLLTGMLTWLHTCFGAEIAASDKYGTFMYRALNDRLADTPGLYAWCGLIAVLLTAMLMGYANTRFRLIDRIPYLPAFCYVLLIGGVPEIHLFNPASIAVILLVASFIFLAESFESERLSYSYFVAPVFISIATFFHQYMYVYMSVVWLVIAFFRPGYWREWVFSVLGFALPLFLAFSWFFLIDDDYTRMGVFFDEIFAIQRAMPSVSVSTVVFIALSIAAGIFTFWYLLQYLGSKKVIIRNKYDVLIMIAGITAVLAFIVPDMIPMAWYLLAFPMSFILSYRLADTKSIRWNTVVLLILFAGVAAAQAVYLSTR